MKVSRTIRHLRNAVVFAAVRGAATAAGSSLVGMAFWWITSAEPGSAVPSPHGRRPPSFVPGAALGPRRDDTGQITYRVQCVRWPESSW